MVEVGTFKQEVEDTILDPSGVHREFVSGGHGQKLDFGLILDESRLYGAWVDVNVEAIKVDGRPTVAVCGVASGTIHLTHDVGDALGVEVLDTQKKGASPREVELTPESLQELVGLIMDGTPEGVIRVVEDVGTTGGTALTAVESIQEVLSGLKVSQELVAVEGLFTWQRAFSLPAFDKAGVPYGSIIRQILPTYQPEDCAERGFCAEGWKLIPYGQ
jgi:adenine/guanine phosphoribosyltransferase-like PRPP-binding protein